MSGLTLEQLKYPIGTYNVPETIDRPLLEQWIDDIAAFPKHMTEAVVLLEAEQLTWLYRPGGWSIRQVVHHCADSHINAFMRFKLTLTEDTPAIRPYLEAKWAALPDGDNNNIQHSLAILNGIHSRWTVLLKNLGEDELQKEFYHPEHDTTFTLASTIGNYAWHSNHHLAHVRQALKYKNQFDLN